MEDPGAALAVALHDPARRRGPAPPPRTPPRRRARGPGGPRAGGGRRGRGGRACAPAAGGQPARAAALWSPTPLGGTVAQLDAGAGGALGAPLPAGRMPWQLARRDATAEEVGRLRPNWSRPGSSSPRSRRPPTSWSGSGGPTAAEAAAGPGGASGSAPAGKVECPAGGRPPAGRSGGRHASASDDGGCFSGCAAGAGAPDRHHRHRHRPQDPPPVVRLRARRVLCVEGDPQRGEERSVLPVRDPLEAAALGAVPCGHCQ